MQICCAGLVGILLAAFLETDNVPVGTLRDYWAAALVIA